MSSKQIRKEKRLKEQVKAGAEALQERKRYEAELENTRNRLAYVTDELVRLQEEFNEIQRECKRLRAENALLDSANDVIVRNDKELAEANDALRSKTSYQEQTIETMRKQIASLEAADRDSAKLRRRLAERAKEVDRLQLELSRYRKERAEAC